MKCCFCEKEVESIDEAVQLGWYPDFWVGDVNYRVRSAPSASRSISTPTRKANMC